MSREMYEAPMNHKKYFISYRVADDIWMMCDEPDLGEHSRPINRVAHWWEGICNTRIKGTEKYGVPVDIADPITAFAKGAKLIMEEIKRDVNE
jgi:hypothetical protein